MDEPGRDGTLAFVLRVGAGCVLAAGLVALLAVATGDFDRTDGKLIATSVGFGVFSAFAASGLALAGRPEPLWRAVVGWGGVAASIVAFLLLTAALWLPEPQGDDVWRWWAMAGIAALWCWHAGAILGPRRDDDGTLLAAVSTVAVAALGIDALGAIAALAHWFERPLDEFLIQAFAAVLVVAVVASVLVPLLRRLERARPQAPPDRPLAAPAVAAPVAWGAAHRRRPSELLATSWREGDALTRGLLVACGVVPVLAGVALALAWPGSPAPATVRTLTVASPPVTVTEVPPEPAAAEARSESADDFSAADSAAIIARRRARFDREAARSASRLAPIVERCFAKMQDFTACDTPVELPAAAKARLSLGMGQAQVAVVASSVTAFTIAAQSRSGSTFTLTRDPSGTLRRTCTPAGSGGCRTDGTWAR